MASDAIAYRIEKHTETAMFGDVEFSFAMADVAYAEQAERLKKQMDSVKEMLEAILRSQVPHSRKSTFENKAREFLEMILSAAGGMWLDRQHVVPQTNFNDTLGLDLAERQQLLQKMTEMLPDKECSIFSFTAFFGRCDPTVPMLEATERFFLMLANKDKFKTLDLTGAPIEVYRTGVKCFPPSSLNRLNIGIPGDDFVFADDAEDEEDVEPDRTRLLEFINSTGSDGQHLAEKLVKMVSNNGRMSVSYNSSDAQPFVQLCQQIRRGLDTFVDGSNVTLEIMFHCFRIADEVVVIETYLSRIVHGLSLITSLQAAKNIHVDILLDIHNIDGEEDVGLSGKYLLPFLQMPGISVLRAGSFTGEIANKTAEAVTRAMRDHLHLKKLDFYWGAEISGSLARAVLQGLDTNTSLEWFHLETANEPVDRIVDTTLAKVLPLNRHLKYLYYNPGNFPAFVDALMRNTGLTNMHDVYGWDAIFVRNKLIDESNQFCAESHTFDEILDKLCSLSCTEDKYSADVERNYQVVLRPENTVEDEGLENSDIPSNLTPIYMLIRNCFPPHCALIAESVTRKDATAEA